MRKLVAGLCCSLLAGGVAAEDGRVVAPYVGLEIENNSNIQRAESDPIEDTKIAPYVGVEYEDVAGDYESKVSGELRRETFQDNTFSDDTLITFDGYFDWVVVPGRFTWAVEDYADQYRINVKQRDNPGNRQTVNVFATGPDFLFSNELGDLLVKARYADVSYSETEEDSRRFIAAGSLKRVLNAYSALHVDTTLSLVDYDASWADDYDVITTGLRYRRDLPYGVLSGAVGYNGFDFDSGKSKNDPYYDLNLRLNLGGGSSVELSGAFKLTDLALESFNPLYTRLLDDLDINTLFEQTTERGSSGVYRVNRGFGSYTFTGDLLSTTVFGYTNRQRYFENVTNNFNETGVGMSLGYQLSSGIYLYAGASAADVSYIDVDEGVDVDWLRYTAAASYNLAENMFIIGGVIKEDSQDNQDVQITGDDDINRDFKNTMVYLKFEYRVKPPQAANN